jgi:hypothetical protein
MSTATLTKAVLSLPQAERTALLLDLFDSLPADLADQDEILAEAMRRDEELESGAVREMSHEEFIAGIRLPQRA